MRNNCVIVVTTLARYRGARARRLTFGHSDRHPRTNSANANERTCNFPLPAATEKRDGCREKNRNGQSALLPVAPTTTPPSCEATSPRSIRPLRKLRYTKRHFKYLPLFGDPNALCLPKLQIGQKDRGPTRTVKL